MTGLFKREHLAAARAFRIPGRADTGSGPRAYATSVRAPNPLCSQKGRPDRYFFLAVAGAGENDASSIMTWYE